VLADFNIPMHVPHVTDDCICCHEGWQDGDAAYCQITLDTDYFCCSL